MPIAEYALNTAPAARIPEKWKVAHCFPERYLGNDNPNVVQQQREDWIRDTGISPEDSVFSIVVPIHNEHVMLPSMLHAFSKLDIPRGTNVTVDLVTNNCSDSSGEIVDTFLSSLGPITHTQLTIPEMEIVLPVDQRINTVYTQTHLAGMKFRHFDTRTPGKANALTLSNGLAVLGDIPIAICIDANDFPAQDAVRKLFAAIYKGTGQETQTTVASGAAVTDYQQKNSAIIYQVTDKFIPPVDKTYKVNGRLMAWHTRWVQESGGVPATATEDYSLGLLALATGKTVQHVPEAKIYGYTSNNFTDRMKQRVRYKRGHLQNLAYFQQHFPETYLQVEQYLAEQSGSAPDFTRRMQLLLSELQQPSVYTPRRLAKFVLDEYAWRQAERQFIENPDNISWAPIASTKE